MQQSRSEFTIHQIPVIHLQRAQNAGEPFLVAFLKLSSLWNEDVGHSVIHHNAGEHNKLQLSLQYQPAPVLLGHHGRCFSWDAQGTFQLCAGQLRQGSLQADSGDRGAGRSVSIQTPRALLAQPQPNALGLAPSSARRKRGLRYEGVFHRPESCVRQHCWKQQVAVKGRGIPLSSPGPRCAAFQHELKVRPQPGSGPHCFVTIVTR